MKTPLKYAGSKSKLSKEIQKYMPEDTTIIIEPFCGSGAYSFMSGLPFVLKDSQGELINFWRVLGSDPKALISEIKILASQSNSEFYLKIRNQDRIEGYENVVPVLRAARYYYIVYAGYNTGYRVNKKNQCNIPWGGDTRKFCLDEEKLLLTSRYLRKNCRGILHEQFDENTEKLLGTILKQGDKPFFLIDPPYVDGDDKKKVYREYSSDTIDGKFYDRLFNFMNLLEERGLPFLMTNTYCEYILDMFCGWKIDKVATKYSVSASGESRGEKFEAFTSNYGRCRLADQ